MAGPSSKKDPYAALGVARDADADTIKKAYRAQAQKYHPDRNTDDPDAEEQFKRISVANAVLSDPERRKSYDEFGEIALDPNFDAEKARQASQGFGGGDFSNAFTGGGGRGGFEFRQTGDLGSLFEDLFGGAGGARHRAPRARRGADLETSLELDFLDAVQGSEQRIVLDRPGARADGRETLTVTIPPGVDEGARIRLSGKGGPGASGGPAGDLFATISVRPHSFIRRDDRDLSMEAPISVVEAIRGASIEIPTLDGRVNLRIPAGTDGGSRLRLRGKGVPASAGKPAGDLYVTVRIRVPKDLPTDSQEKLEELIDDDASAWRREPSTEPAPMHPHTVLTLVRHGETPANLDGVWHGSIDTSLTDRGRRQAERVALYLADRHQDASALYASPLQRAEGTARIIGVPMALSVSLEPGLTEYDLGSWEGLTYRELYTDKQLWTFMKTDPDFAPHGGESPIQATLRFCDALATIAQSHPGERVIVVAHGGVMSLALAHIVEGHYTRWSRVMDNCAVSELVLEPSPELLSFNHIAHLEGV